MNEQEASKIGSLEVWWIRNPPGKVERYPVMNIDEAIKKLDALAKDDLQNDNVVCNAGGLEILTEDGWEEYE